MVRLILRVLGIILTLTNESAWSPSALATVKRAHTTAHLSIVIVIGKRMRGREDQGSPHRSAEAPAHFDDL